MNYDILISDMFIAVSCIRDRIDYLTTRLRETMDGLGTDDTGLGRLIVWRSEIDLAEISYQFQKKYGRSLRDAIRASFSLWYSRKI